MVNHPNRSKMPRLTAREWEAVLVALQYATCGEDPWEAELPKGSTEDSPTWKAVQSAIPKIAARVRTRND